MYQVLINKIKTIKDSSKDTEKETFFDICGYPHYENVVSNVLAFFLDPSKGHGLGTLCIEAFLDLVGADIQRVDELWEVEREVITDSGKFIDILVKSDEHIILIENKVFAALYNDLNDYFRYVQKAFKGKAIHPIVLCLNTPVMEDEVLGYKVITYDELFSKIRSYLGGKIEKADFRYMQLLTDLMHNMKKLKEGTKMNEDFVQLISEHNEELLKLLEEIKIYRDDLRKKVKEVNSLIPDEINGVQLKRWEHRDLTKMNDIAVINFTIGEGVNLAIETVIDHNGWRFEIYRIGSASSFSLVDFCTEKGLEGEISNGRYIISKTYSFNENIQKVVEEINHILAQLTK